MTLKKKANQEHNTLQIKILSGYLLLFLLVGSIIVVVWYEKQVFERAEVEERVVLEQHQLSNRIFKSLLSLFLDNEYVTHWDDNDLQTYQNRQKRVFLLLEELRNTYPDSMQAARIDTVKTLLFEKEKHLKLLVKTPSTVSQIDSFLSKELPLLAVPVSTSQKQEEKEAKKKGIFSWLKRKKKESPSPKQNTYAYKVRQFRDGVSTTQWGRIGNFCKQTYAVSLDLGCYIENDLIRQPVSEQTANNGDSIRSRFNRERSDNCSGLDSVAGLYSHHLQ